MRFIKKLSDFEVGNIYYTDKSFIGLNGQNYNDLKRDKMLDVVEINSIGMASFFKVTNITSTSISTTHFSYLYNQAKYSKENIINLKLDFKLLEHYDIKVLEVDNIKSFPFKYQDNDGFYVSTIYNDSDLLKYKLTELVKSDQKSKKSEK